jgi:hypothetical protein
MESPMDLLLKEPVRQVPPPRPLEPLGVSPDTVQIISVRMTTFTQEIIEYNEGLERRIKALEDRVKLMAEELEGQKNINYHLGENALGYHLRQKSSDSSDLSDSKRDMSGSEIPQGTFGRCDLLGILRQFVRGKPLNK